MPSKEGRVVPYDTLTVFESPSGTKEFRLGYNKALKEIEASEQERQEGWRDMESCPINELVFIWTKEPLRDCGKLTNVVTEIWDGIKLSCGSLMGYKAKYWQPLPNPPIEEK